MFEFLNRARCTKKTETNTWQEPDIEPLYNIFPYLPINRKQGISELRK